MNLEESNIGKNPKKHKSANRKLNYQLVLYNDDINTFDFVIETLIHIMNYHETQAEQLALLTHYRGMMTIKKGFLEDLTSFSEKLNNKGLVSEVLNN
jgi:ATP-dependent Clp protease adaptor protein ClpS